MYLVAKGGQGAPILINSMRLFDTLDDAKVYIKNNGGVRRWGGFKVYEFNAPGATAKRINKKELE